ncbi:GRP family sugar transporter [Niabella aurantiaca]|uniref:GRP family sugar transporter n=1 Tax=Niabella aurantiaca TaxID=379900 RepID=UPI00038112E9|nr:GRP family sugar transporter [Niabella aurantiaca]
MFIVHNYTLAVIFCFITMLCWGSWGNTQKLAARTWRYELFYWDYVVGVLLFSLIAAFTLGSIGNEGRSFLADLMQASGSNMLSAFVGGIIFNASNILLSAAIAIAGMSVAFPLGVGIALVLGVVVNYIGAQKGDPMLLFLGVTLIVVAIILNALAYRSKGETQKSSFKGILISVIAGVLMAFFYRFIAGSMDLDNFSSPATGKMTPYTAVFIFSTGIFASNFIFNTLLMKRPFVGAPVSYKDYFSGNFSTHLTGVLGGLIWGLGNSLNLIAAGKAGAAISYGLGQGATMVAAFWGVFIWKEFRDARKNVNGKLALMFLLFIAGIVLIIAAGK